MSDTPTHRTYLSQLNLNYIAELVRELQARRALITEKIRKATENSKVAEERKRSKQIDRICSKILKNIKDAETRLDIAADELNKARGLFLEVSDGQVLLSRTEVTDGSITKNATDRRDTKTSTT